MYKYLTKEQVHNIIKSHFGQGFKRILLELSFTNALGMLNQEINYNLADLLAEDQFQEWLNENLPSDRL